MLHSILNDRFGPSLAHGYCHGRGDRPLYPELWSPPPAALYYPPAGNTGLVLRDYSGHKRHGTFGAGAAAPTWGVGRYGPQLSFDGSNDKVTVAGFPFVPAPFTLSCWAKGTAPGDGTYHQHLIARGAVLEVNTNFALMVRHSSLIVRFFWYNGGDQYGLDAGGWTNDIWHHVAVTMSNNGSATTYIDGVVKASAGAQPVPSGDGGQPLTIGSPSNIAQHPIPWLGDICNAGVWPLDLSSGLIRLLAADPAAPLRRKPAPAFWYVGGGGPAHYDESVSFGVDLDSAIGARRDMKAAIALGQELSSSPDGRRDLLGALAFALSQQMMASAIGSYADQIAFGIEHSFGTQAKLAFHEAVSLGLQGGYSAAALRAILGGIDFGMETGLAPQAKRRLKAALTHALQMGFSASEGGAPPAFNPSFLVSLLNQR